MNRKILAGALGLLLIFATVPVDGQNFGFTTRALQEMSRALTAAGRFGAPRYTTALLPTCGTSNRGALAYDTTLTTLVVCVPNAWTSTGLNLAGTNEFSGQTNISGPDATSNVEIGSTGTDANAGTGGTSTVIGNGATNSGNSTGVVAIGSTATISGSSSQNTIFISPAGTKSGIGGQAHVGIGNNITDSSTGNNIIVLGNQSGATGSAADSVCIGATCTTALSNVFIAGANGFGFLDVYFGEGVSNTTAAAWILHGTGGSGADNAGADLSIMAGLGTGTGAGSQVNLDRALMRATSSTVQASANGLTVCESKTLSNTSATATAIANVAIASNSAGAVRITVSVRCDDGTNFDSDLVTSYVAFVNKATVVTVGTPVTTASAAANNSGSCTVAPTFVASGNTIDIKVTPVITTIVPTTTTAVVNIENFGAGAVACN